MKNSVPKWKEIEKIMWSIVHKNYIENKYFSKEDVMQELWILYDRNSRSWKPKKISFKTYFFKNSKWKIKQLLTTKVLKHLYNTVDQEDIYE